MKQKKKGIGIKYTEETSYIAFKIWRRKPDE